MFVVDHRFLEWEKALEVALPLFSPPAGIILPAFLPNVDGSNAICLWEADSLKTVKTFVASTLGDPTNNELFAVDAKQACGLRQDTVGEQASTM